MTSKCSKASLGISRFQRFVYGQGVKLGVREEIDFDLYKYFIQMSCSNMILE